MTVEGSKNELNNFSKKGGGGEKKKEDNQNKGFSPVIKRRNDDIQRWMLCSWLSPLFYEL